MTKIFADLKKKINIKNYNCDGIIVHSEEYSCYNDDKFVFSELEEVVNKIKAYEKLAILDVDRIISENDVDNVTTYLENVYQLFDYFIYSDMAIYYFFDEKGLLEKLIYDPKTLVASTKELSVYNETGVKVILANELSFEEIKDIACYEKVCLQAYGYHQMFYSRRNLISLYKEYFSLEESVKNKKFYLEEEIRNDLYPIYESSHGTFIYTNYIYCAFLELLEIKNNLEMIRINGIFLDDEKYLKVINLYKSLLDGEKDPLVLYQELVDIDSNVSKGFLLNKSVLLKREENESKS